MEGGQKRIEGLVLKNDLSGVCAELERYMVEVRNEKDLIDYSSNEFVGWLVNLSKLMLKATDERHLQLILLQNICELIRNHTLEQKQDEEIPMNTKYNRKRKKRRVENVQSNGDASQAIESKYKVVLKNIERFIETVDASDYNTVEIILCCHVSLLEASQDFSKKHLDLLTQYVQKLLSHQLKLLLSKELDAFSNSVVFVYIPLLCRCYGKHGKDMLEQVVSSLVLAQIELSNFITTQKEAKIDFSVINSEKGLNISWSSIISDNFPSYSQQNNLLLVEDKANQLPALYTTLAFFYYLLTRILQSTQILFPLETTLIIPIGRILEMVHNLFDDYFIILPVKHISSLEVTILLLSSVSLLDAAIKITQGAVVEYSSFVIPLLRNLICISFYNSEEELMKDKKLPKVDTPVSKLRTKTLEFLKTLVLVTPELAVKILDDIVGLSQQLLDDSDDLYKVELFDVLISLMQTIGPFLSLEQRRELDYYAITVFSTLSKKRTPNETEKLLIAKAEKFVLTSISCPREGLVYSGGLARKFLNIASTMPWQNSKAYERVKVLAEFQIIFNPAAPTFVPASRVRDIMNRELFLEKNKK